MNPPDESLPTNPFQTGARPCALLVDDEPSIRSIMTLVLDKLGYSVSAVASSEEGLKMAGKPAGERFDLLITDLVMPGMNGKDFARKIVEITPSTKVIFMSGFPEAVAIGLGIDLHKDCFLKKPASLEALRGAIAALCGELPPAE
ncbi:MAG: response regulator [Verrucomicrobia bacterium]|nr:response regulator [Verrucomicrobiota bacterium]